MIPENYGTITAKEIENTPLSLGKIYTEELLANPDIVQEKLNEHVHAMLAKYGYGFQITGFQWKEGAGVAADVLITRLPETQKE